MRSLSTLFFLFLAFSIVTVTAQPKVIFYDDFEAGAFRPEWVLCPARNNGAIEVSSSAMLQGQYLARLGKSTDGNGDFSLNKLDLPLDLSAYQDAELLISIAHNFDDPHVQDGIYLSDDGRNFVKVFGFPYASWVANIPGRLPPLNLKMLADKHGLSFTTQFVIRFQQYDDHDFIGGAEFSDGLYLDNVTVQTPPADYAPLPFADDFEGDSLSRYWAIGNPSTTDAASEAVINPSGSTALFLSDDTVQRQVVRMGNTIDKNWATNALDLRLNLLGQEDAMLSFKIYNNHDETHPQDGLFFSHDGGKHFTKVYDFDLDQWKAQQFGQLPPLSINQLAHEHDLPLTDQFVIRFQQHDDDDFNGSRLTSDGYFLDDVRVVSRPVTYATLPFVEDFEKAALTPYWHWCAPQYESIATEIKPTGVVETIFFDSLMGRVMRMGSLADRSYITNALDLHIDLSLAEAPALSFWIWDNYDETHAQDGIYFSENGGKDFKKVYDFDGGQWGDKAFGRLYALDIRELAAAQQLSLTNTFVIRFQQHDDDDFEGTRTISDGIYLDNIRIAEPEMSYLTALPLIEGFEADSLAAYWRHGDLTTTASSPTILPDGVACLVDSLTHTGRRALLLGKLTDSHPTVSALDLCLNLAYQKDLELSFWMYSNYDEEDQEDGLWFSSDGGSTFKKAYSFDHSHHATYAPVKLNMDSLLLETQQNYSDRFIIRFQQLGDRRVGGEGTFRHGVVLDDITITGPLMAPEVSKATGKEDSPN